MLPLMAIFVVAVRVSTRCAGVGIEPGAARRKLIAALLVVSAVFLAVLSPYLRTNKRVFGHYFYNVNTTFYMWYDDWPQASVGTIKHGDGVGWPAMPADESAERVEILARAHRRADRPLASGAGFVGHGRPVVQDLLVLQIRRAVSRRGDSPCCEPRGASWPARAVGLRRRRRSC